MIDYLEFNAFFDEKLKSPLDGLEKIRKSHIRKMLIKLGAALAIFITVAGVVQTQGETWDLPVDASTGIVALVGAGWIAFTVYTATRSWKKFADGKPVMSKVVEEIIHFMDPGLTLYPREFIKPEDTHFPDIVALHRGASDKVNTYFYKYRAENLIKGSYKGLEIEFCVAQLGMTDDKLTTSNRYLGDYRKNITHSDHMTGRGLERSRDSTSGAEYIGDMVFRSQTSNTSTAHVLFTAPAGILGPKPDKTHLISTGDEEFDKNVLTYSRSSDAVVELLSDSYKQKLRQAFDDFSTRMVSVHGDVITIIYHGWPGLFHIELGAKMNKPKNYLERAEYLDVRFEIGRMLAT